MPKKLSWKALLLLVSPLAFVACGSDGSKTADKPDRKIVEVGLSDQGCQLPYATFIAGEVTFRINNSGTDKVTSFEVLRESKSKGKVTVPSGKSKELTLDLKPGTYDFKCPGGSVTSEGIFPVQ